MTSAIKEIFISYDQQVNLMRAISNLPLASCDLEWVNNTARYENAIINNLHQQVIDEILTLRSDRQTVAILIRGLPSDLLAPPTPYHSDDEAVQAIPVARIINLGIYKLLNLHPVTYQGENNGQLFRHITPKKADVNKKTSYGSRFPLGMHVDNCYLPLTPEPIRQGYSSCPEFLSWFSIRCDLQVATKITIVDEVLKQLDEDCILQLMQPDYLVKSPDSFSNQQQFHLPILVQDSDGIFYCRFDHDFVSPKGKPAEKAFNKFTQLLADNIAYHLILQPGDFFIFKNQRVMHGRDSFIPRFDGQDRWMLRLFGVSSLHRVFPVDSSNDYHVIA